jgi:flavin-dependent dehydrogenase
MILVAGGGPAGAAAAALLAKAGREVVLVEREAAPAHKICGEFLSTEAQEYLAALGMDVAVLGGHRMTHVRLVRGARVITAKLPFEGLGVTRRRLDEALLAHAAACGVEVRRGQAVRHVRGLAVEVDRGGVLHPEILMLATGKHEARGAARDARPSELVGFKNYFRLAPAQRAMLAGHVELILLPGGYAGLELVEDGTANLSLLVEREALRAAGGGWEGLLAVLLREPHLASRLAGAEAVLPAPLTIARVPYGFVHRAGAGDSDSVFRLGDQAAVIQSFTGDGMSMALHSAVLAAGCVLAGEGAAEYHRRFAAGVRGQVWRAGALHGLLRSRWVGGAAFAGAAVFPRLLAVSAALTRVPERARRGTAKQPMSM